MSAIDKKAMNMEKKIKFACSWTDKDIKNVLRNMESLLKQQRRLSEEYHKSRFSSETTKEVFFSIEENIKKMLGF